MSGFRVNLIPKKSMTSHITQELRKISLKTTMNMGRQVTILIAYNIQSFQQFSVSFFAFLDFIVSIHKLLPGLSFYSRTLSNNLVRWSRGLFWTRFLKSRFSHFRVRKHLFEQFFSFLNLWRRFLAKKICKDYPV